VYLTQGIQVTSQTSAWHWLGRCDFREFSCKVVSSDPYNRTLVKVLELRSKGYSSIRELPNADLPHYATKPQPTLACTAAGPWSPRRQL